MLGLPPSVRIYFAAALVDMRKGIDGLRALVEEALKKDPYGGHLFVFVGKSKDKVKILFWHLRGAPDQSLRVPHRRPRPRAGSSRERHRCAAARRLDRRPQRRLTGLRHDGDGRTVAVKTYYRERLRCKGRPSAEPRSATRASASAKSAATPGIRRSRARRPRSSRSA